MKKFTSSLLLTVMISFLTTSNSFSQESDGKSEKENYSVVTGGAGFSLVGAIFSVVQKLSDAVPGSEFHLKHTPVIVGNFDYVFKKKFSLGAAYTYQAFDVSYKNYEYKSNGATLYGTWEDHVTRSNFAVRPIFHFGNKDNFDPYFGCRLGFTQWKFNSYNPDPNFIANDFYGSKFNSGIRFQAFFGVRYYFTDFFGFNMEVAVGPTYFSMLGLSAKF